MKTYWVYILTSRSRALYIGVTGDLARRLYQHRTRTVPGFARRYFVDRLVYVEATSDVNAAIAREKQIKRWTRAKKVALIEAANPEWRDLGGDWPELKQ